MTFFLVFSFFLALGYAYIGLRLIPGLGSAKRQLPAWLILLFFYLALVTHLYLRITGRITGFDVYLAWSGYLFMGLASCLYLLVVSRDLVLILAWVSKKTAPFLKRSKPGCATDPGRRAFLMKASSAVIAGTGLTAAGTGLYLALKEPVVVPVTLTLPPHARGLAGLTLVQFSDLHAGPTIGFEFIQRVSTTIASLNPDIIVFTGDLADGSPEELSYALSSLSSLSAPLGKFYITGNHEYYFGALRWIRHAETLGFTPLLNTHQVISHNQSRLVMAGVTDMRASAMIPGHSSSPGAAFENAPDNSFRILLAHHPASVYQADGLDVDLQLSGHTHGGQYLPFNLAVRMEHPFVKGLYRHNGTRVYVNQGTGYWGPPLRLGTEPEITRFTFC